MLLLLPLKYLWIFLFFYFFRGNSTTHVLLSFASVDLERPDLFLKSFHNLLYSPDEM